MSKSPWRRNDLIYLNRHSGNGYGNGEGGGGGGTGGSGIAVIGKYPTNIYGLYNLTSYGGMYFDTTASYQNMRMWVAGSGQLPVYDTGQTGLAYHKFIRYTHNRNISMASNAAALYCEMALDGYLYYIPKGTSLSNTAYRICDSNGNPIQLSSQQFSITQNNQTCYMFKYITASAQQLADADNALRNGGIYNEGCYYVLLPNNMTDDELIKRFNLWKRGYTTTLSYYDVDEIQNYLI